MTVSENIGFIGLGAMGYGMAQNIRKKMSPSATLYVYDVAAAALDNFVSEFSSCGPISICDSPKDVAVHSTVIISMVPGPKHVEDVYLNPVTGVSAAGSHTDGPRLLVDSSTIDCDTTRSVCAKIKAATGDDFVDAPVSGGIPGALTGNLAFMVGSKEDDEVGSRVKPIISYMGNPSKFFFCGSQGAALATKICNNYLAGISLAAVSEAMNMGMRLGVDKHVLFNAIHNSSGQSFAFDQVNPVPGVVPTAPCNNDYVIGTKSHGFRIQLMVKDMGLGVDAAEKTGARSSVGKAALELYKEASSDPWFDNRDVSGIYHYMGGPTDN